VASLTLNGVAVDLAAPIDVTDIDGDGISELTVRFSREAVAATAASGSSLDLLLAGTVAGNVFSATDQVKVVGNEDILTWDPGLAAGGAASKSGSEKLELRAVAPNPMRAGSFLNVAFSAHGGVPTRLEVIDLSGRRVAEAELGAGSGGFRNARVALQRSLPPGLYLVRLTQRSEVATAKFAVTE
jgi:hypothetical protein